MRSYRLTVTARASKDAVAATHAAASRAREEGTTAATLPANGSISKMTRNNSSGMSDQDGHELNPVPGARSLSS